ncbi:MAG TPA: hypothetical protein VFC05_14975 [Nitrososphaeraceae archaeon]|mgnify:CR=1 FL=1|jgi:hypothetical protein|nr:hypothetical protein [Nitrososphaeraceae archaeon]
MKDRVKVIEDNKSYDEGLDKLQNLASEIGNIYFTTYLQENPNASIFEREIITQILNLSIDR